MKGRGQKSEVRSPKRRAVALSSLLVWFALDSLAQEELPKLLPPHAELPPTFWEQHGVMIVIVVVVVLLLVALGIWARLRPKPAVVTPVEVQARTALEALRNRPEDGATISAVSQILRRYVIAAFELPLGEYSTAEFRQLASDSEKIGAELSSALSDFMIRCDERKFSRSDASASASTVAKALELVAIGETRRAHLRQVAVLAGQPATANA